MFGRVHLVSVKLDLKDTKLFPPLSLRGGTEQIVLSNPS